MAVVESVGALVRASASPTDGDLPALFRTWTVYVNFPQHASKFYQLGGSLSFNPGIPTVSGTVCLTADPFFFLVLVASNIFQNFSGQLDALGRATAQISIPNFPVLIGLISYHAGVAYDGTGTILTISEPRAVVIE